VIIGDNEELLVGDFKYYSRFSLKKVHKFIAVIARQMDLIRRLNRQI
jgi:hypothetical protein